MITMHLKVPFEEDQYDDEERELIMQMSADGVAEEVIKIKLETWAYTAWQG